MRKNRTRYVLLGLLAEGAKSGYELKQEIETAIGHFWNESYGQIYPQLQQLADDGLAERFSESSGRRERFLYRITPAGRETLRLWLEEPPEPETLRHELLLKIFFGSNTTPEVLQRHLAEFQARAERLVLTLRSIQAQLADIPPEVAEKPYWLLTIRAGEAAAAARLAWSRDAIETLAQIPAPSSDTSRKGESQ